MRERRWARQTEPLYKRFRGFRRGSVSQQMPFQRRQMHRYEVCAQG